MTAQMLFVLGVTGVALLLFVSEAVAPDVVALIVMVSLGLGGILDLPTLFSGFSSPVIMTLIGIFILGAALHNTGVTAYAGRILLRLTQSTGERRLIGILALASATASLFMNTVGAVALVAPVGRHVSEKLGYSPSRVLMPISFAALLGGMATLLTTSNLVVSSLLQQNGLAGFSLLSFLPVGGPITAAGIVYLLLASPRLLPERSPSDITGAMREAIDRLPRTYDLSARQYEAVIQPGSPLDGKPLRESGLGEHYGVTISVLVRGRQVFAPPSADAILRAGDSLLLQGREKETNAAAGALGLELAIYSDARQNLLMANDTELAEISLAPRTGLIGKTLADLRFRERYHLNVLGIWHEGRPIRSYLADYSLNAGDALLVQGTPEQIRQIGEDTNFLVMTRLPEIPERTDRAIMAMVILGLFLLGLFFESIPEPLVALMAGIALIVTGCVTPEQARRSLQWQVIFIISGMLPLAIALQQTGALDFLVGRLMNPAGGWTLRAMVLAFFLLTASLTQLIPGQVASLIVGPIAIAAALEYGFNPYALAMTVGITASTAFLSPVAHPANLLVMGPGGYHFADYPRLGLPLTIIAGIGVVGLIPVLYR